MRFFLVQIFAFCLFLGFFTACQPNNLPQFTNLSIQQLDTFSMPNSIRAIQALDQNTLWFAGSEGIYGYTISNSHFNITPVEFGVIQQFDNEYLA